MIVTLLVACLAAPGPSGGAALPLRLGAPVAALEARLSADVSEGEFPLEVSFDATGSTIGSRAVRYEWSFGDGASSADARTTAHTYVGEGAFGASLTLVDEATGERSVAEVTVEVDEPDCPHEDRPVEVGRVDDAGLDGVSSLVASRVHPDVLWLQEDAGGDELVAIDTSGRTLSEHDLPNDVDDVEDLAAAIDPATGVSLLFLGDLGDNDERRRDVVVWVLPEPDPFEDSDPDPLEMELTYPHGPVDAETLLVDPWTLDLYVVTKSAEPEQAVYRKRAPHDGEGPYELEDLGTWSELDFTVTSGDVSPDGGRVVIRGYGETALLWHRDGYRSLEEVFDESPCRVDLASEPMGEAITFTLDGGSLMTTSEHARQPLYAIEL